MSFTATIKSQGNFTASVNGSAVFNVSVPESPTLNVGMAVIGPSGLLSADAPLIYDSTLKNLSINLSDYATLSYVNSTFQTQAGMSAYYLASNPAGYIDSSALAPYLTSATAALTYQTIAGMSQYATNTALNIGLSTKLDKPAVNPLDTQILAYDAVLGNVWIDNYARSLFAVVRNETGEPLAKGTIVYIDGASGNKPLVKKAIASAEMSSSKTFAVLAQDILNKQNGNAITFGELTKVDTFGLPEGVALWLSPTVAGTWTTTKPSAPNHVVFIGNVIRAHQNQGVIEVRIQNGYELEELHDVAVLDRSNNDVLVYESSTSLWKSKTISEVLGYTPADSASLANYLTISSAASTYYPLTNPTGYITSAALSPYLLSATAASTYQPIGDYATNTALTNGLATKANAVHTHTIEQVNGLTEELAGKQPVGDYATNSALTAGLATKQPVGDYATNTDLANGLLTKAPVVHTHTISQVDGLTEELSGKQPVGDYATNTDLTTGLAGKADAIHTHDASAIVSGVIDIARIPVIPSQVQVFANEPDITQLTIAEQDQITGAGAVVILSNGERWMYKGTGSKTDYASYVQISDLTPDWNSIENKPTTFAPSAHTHPISDVTGLQTALDGKSPLFDQSLNTTDSVSFANLTTDSVTIPNGVSSMVIDPTGILFTDGTLQTTAGVSQTYLSGELSNYLTITSAASTYQTISGMSDYLTTASAASTYQPVGSYAVTNASNEFVANQVISVTDNTNAALRITQMGSGEAFRVEDSANPDASPFVINSAGQVGIGTTSLTGRLNVLGNSILADSGSSLGVIGVTQNGTGPIATFTNNASSTADAFRITNLGTGNSFVVEDSANPDSTPFVIDSQGRVGIGTGATGNALTVGGSFYIAHGGGTSPAAAFSFSNTNALGLWASQYNTNPAFTITNAGTGASLRINDEVNDTTPFIVDAGGNVGVKTASPTTDFEVVGTGKFSGGIYFGDGTLQTTAGVTSLAGYATEAWVTSQGYLTAPYNPFDQFLNTTSDVVFNKVTASAVGSISTVITPSVNENNNILNWKTGSGFTLKEFYIKPNDIRYTDNGSSEYWQLNQYGMSVYESYGSVDVYAGEGIYFYNNGSGEQWAFDSNGLYFADGTTQTTAATTPDLTPYAQKATTNTFTASQVVEVTDNTNAALRITQLGTGEAIRVEDSASPDSSPFIVNANGRVGIGTTTTGTFPLTVAGGAQFTSGNVEITASSFANGLTVKSSSSGNAVRITNTGSGNSLVVEDSDNPDSSPFVIDSNGWVGIQKTTASAPLDLSFGGGGNAVIFTTTGSATNTFIRNTSTASGTALAVVNEGSGNSFVVEDSASPDTTRFTIDGDGNVAIKSNGTNASYPLLVGGNSWLQGFVNIQTGSSSGGLGVYYTGTNIAANIRNAGTGLSLRVGDEDPDGTPFVVDANGNVGVKTDSPSTDFEVVGNGKFSSLLTSDTFAGRHATYTTTASGYESISVQVGTELSDFPAGMYVKDNSTGDRTDISTNGVSIQNIFSGDTASISTSALSVYGSGGTSQMNQGYIWLYDSSPNFVELNTSGLTLQSSSVTTMAISHSGITFPDSSVQSKAYPFSGATATAIEGGLLNADAPSSTNPYATEGYVDSAVSAYAAYVDPLLLTTSQKEALSAADLPSSTNPVVTESAMQSYVATEVPAASDTVAGKIEIATRAEAIAGVSTTLAVSPDGLSSQLVKIDDYGSPTVSGVFTWTKPAGAKMIMLRIWSAGSGGASGRCDLTTNARAGGGGGAGGAQGIWFIPASDLPDTVSVGVGAGGSGGAASNVTGTQNNGIAGQQSYFGGYRCGPNNGGSGATGGTAPVTGGMFNLINSAGSGAGANGQTTTGSTANSATGGQFVPLGGGGGGGAAAGSTINVNGGVGGARINGITPGQYNSVLSGGTAGLAASSTQAGNGNNADVTYASGSGGGGGYYRTGENGGNGGNGGWPASGGGGGGAADAGFFSGKGGNGANGRVIVTTFF